MTSDNIYENLIEQLNATFRHIRLGSFKTRERYYKAMKRFCRFLAETYRLERLANVSPKHLFAYVNYMKSKGLAASTIKTDLSGIHYWHDAIPKPRYKLPKNDRLDLKRRSFGTVDRTWSIPEFNKFLIVCVVHGHEEYAAVARLARYAGLRIHECFRIDTAIAENAIKHSGITIKGKGGKIRTVPIGEDVRTELGKFLAITKRGSKLFVADDEKTHLAINKLQQFIAAHRPEVQDEGSDKPMTFHGLRHTCAVDWYTKLIAEGKTDYAARKQVSLWLGHERDDVTLIYLASLKDGDGDV